MDRMCLHAAAVTKLRAMARELLSDAEMDALIAAQDLPSFLETARRYPLFSEIPGGERTIPEIEAYLEERFVHGVQSIEHFYPQDYKRFFRRVRDRFLIESMKNLARRSGVVALFDTAASEMRGGAAGLTAAPDSLQRSRELLAEARVKVDMSLFQLEMFLDQNYFQRLAKAAKDLNAADRKVAQEIIGVEADLQNLRWIIRAKRYYALEPSLIFNYALGAGKVYREDALQAMSRMSLDEVQALAQTSPYRDVFLGDLDKGILRFDAYLLRVIRRAKAENALSLASFLDFLHEWEFQLRDLSTILEAKAYGLAPDNLLIRKLVF